MSSEAVARLITAIQSLPELVEDDPILPQPFVNRWLARPPRPWNPLPLEQTFGVTLPPDLVDLWNQTAGLHLYEEINYGQWGLVIWSPEETLKQTAEHFQDYQADEFRTGDLVIGELIGDSEYFVLRCDPYQPDFGSILIAMPIDRRKEWPTIGTSLIRILENFIELPDKTSWFYR